jgi:glycosyltransferase involved in cell wall biosynthesis
MIASRFLVERVSCRHGNRLFIMTVRTRLLVVSVTLGSGGAERFTSTLLQHLDRHRLEPHLCLLRGPVTYALPGDAPLTILEKTRPRHIPRTIWRLRKLIQRLRPDVIIGTMLYTNWLIGAAMAGLTNRPGWVARFAAPPTIHETNADLLVAPCARQLLGRASAWVANSRALAKAVGDWLPGPPRSVTTIYNPVDIMHIEREAIQPLDRLPRSNVPVLLWAGRLTRQKRPDVLLDAFARVRSSTDAILWVLGEGSLRPDMEAHARRLKVSPYVHFLGFDSNPYRWMARADLFVLTSDYEGLPNALLEAQALGLPAVSTRCPTGPDEIIQQGVTGFLVPAGDPAALAAAVCKILGDPTRQTAMSQASRARIRRIFAVDRVIEPLQNTILGVIPEREAH